MQLLKGLHVVVFLHSPGSMSGKSNSPKLHARVFSQAVLAMLWVCISASEGYASHRTWAFRETSM